MNAKNQPTDAWYRSMHRRMLDVARRRVAVDDAEDVVQQAMQIVVERGVRPGSQIDEQPSLVWCLRVLRNVIGNHYQRTKVRRRHLDANADPERIDVPIEALSADEARAHLEHSLDEFERSEANCGRYLRRLAEGADVGDIAEEEGLTAHAFYQRLYRCRRRFREFLRSRGVLS